MTGFCMARDYDGCLRTVADTGFVYCPEPLCEKDWTKPAIAEQIDSVRRSRTYEDDPEVFDICDAFESLIERVLDVVKAHETAAPDQPLGWTADIRNALEGEL